MKGKMFLFGFLILFMELFSACPDDRVEGKGSDDVNNSQAAEPGYFTDTLKAVRMNRAIGKGMNIGNALEAPEEGAWGVVIKESYIEAIADWAKTHNRPVTIGEYGAIINAAQEHRVTWTKLRNELK